MGPGIGDQGLGKTMGEQLKQALLNAGLVSKGKLKEIEREKVK